MGKEIIKGSEALMRSLIHEGVDCIFGYPGGAIMPVYDSLLDHTTDLRHILVRHEQGAVHAAQGYARTSGRVGTCIVTSGPGATNAITGIGDAMLDSTPLVVITGQVAASLLGSDAFQEIDVVSITQPISKWSYQIRHASDIAWAVARAYYIAGTGRPGPVVLDFAKNAQIELTEYEPYNIEFIRGYNPWPTLSEESIQEAAAIINAAKKPFAVVGQGVELAGANAELLALVEKADIPVGRTLLGLSALPSGHPLNKGMLGMHGNLGPNVKTNECDVLIAIGMRFDDRVTGNLKTYAKQAKVIHFDIDPAEIGKNVKPTVAVIGNCKLTIPAVTALLEKNNHKEWIDSFIPSEEKEHELVIHSELYPEVGPITMGEVVSKVSEATRDHAVLVTDVGQNQMIAARYFRFTEPRSVVTSGGLGTMGFGLPAAIGATFGAPDRTVCLFCGDGGLQMTIQEFGTILESGAPVKIILLNNSYLGMVRQWQELFFNKRYSSTPMINPDFGKIAEAYSIPSRSLHQREQLDEAIQEMLSTDGPFLLEVGVVKESNVFPMAPAGQDVSVMIFDC
jgi:acetolactate synthase I/II/III large subunit